MKKLIYLGPDSHLQFITNQLTDFEILHCNTPELVDAHIADAACILDAYMKVTFPAERLANATNLKLVITATTGANHIAGGVLEARNIPLLTLKGQEHITRNITAAAELSWALLMAVARQLPAALQEAINGEWDRNKFPGMMLIGKTMGVVGCGRIGGWVARYANAFGMKVLGYDPHFETLPEPFERVSLEALLAQSDFVSLHVTYNEQTKNLMNADRIAMMKSGAVLVNTSRGELVEEAALVAALDSGALSGAGLDVLCGEPEIAQNPLVLLAQKNPRVIITPHIGGFSPDALDMVLTFTCGRINEFFK
jgi:phosphoglycerate dehydrogenase-like enzyme